MLTTLVRSQRLDTPLRDANWHHPEYYRLSMNLVLKFIQVFGTSDELKCCNALFTCIHKLWLCGNAEDVYVSVYKVKKVLAWEKVSSVLIILRKLEALHLLQVRQMPAKHIPNDGGGKRLRVFSETYALAPQVATSIIQRLSMSLNHIQTEHALLLQRERYYMCPKHIPLDVKARAMHVKKHTVDFMQANRQSMKCVFVDCQHVLYEIYPNLLNTFYHCPKHLPEDKQLYSEYMRAGAPYMEAWYWKMRCAKCNSTLQKIDGLFWDNQPLPEQFDSVRMPSCYEKLSSVIPEEDDDIESDDVLTQKADVCKGDDLFSLAKELEEFSVLLRAHQNETFTPLYKTLMDLPILPKIHQVPKEFVLLPEFKPLCYQTDALKAFDDGKRSGIALMPCGSGKTALGIMLLCSMRQTGKVIIVCNSYQSIQQWMDSLFRWTTLVYNRKRVSVFHPKSDYHEVLKADVILVSYTLWTRMKLGLKNETIRNKLKTHAHVMISSILLDEVHMVTAETFSLAALAGCDNIVRYGLTATVRSKEHEEQISKSVNGPILYRACVNTLVRSGYLTEVRYNFLKCKPLFDASWPEISVRNRQFSSGLNPCVLTTALKLVDHHKGRKIIIMSDFKAPIKMFKRMLKSHALYVDGSVARDVRRAIYKRFESDSNKILCLTRVGDIALDIPSADVLIQLSYQYGNVIQTVQRGGRLARRKERKDVAENYILVCDEPTSVPFAKQAATYVRTCGFKVNWSHSSVIDQEECKKLIGETNWKTIGTQLLRLK
jgi:superfamily II DNA or RNA helicase